MTRWIPYTLILILSALSAASTTIAATTFEDQGLPLHSFLNDAGPSGRFTSGGNNFNNSFDSTFGAWSGWAISSMTDVVTPDFTNQYSAIPGSGAGGSATYGVAFPFSGTADPFHPADSFIDLADGANPGSIQVTNTTYAYYTMKSGNGFSHAFGPGDFLLLDIRGFNGLGGTGQVVGEVDFYLANFIGANNYIIGTWQTLDLTPLAGAKSLLFGLRSSDNDPRFGINTPSYVAVDDLQLNLVPEPGTAALAAVAVVALAPCCARRRRRPHGC